MILHTPLFNFCNGNLYGENIVIVRNEFPEISFFDNKYTWIDVRKLIKNIKSGVSINLNEFIKKEEMTFDEKKLFVNQFKTNIIDDLIDNGLAKKYFNNRTSFSFSGSIYNIKIDTLRKLFDLKRFSTNGNNEIYDYNQAIRNTLSVIPVYDIKNNIRYLEVRYRIVDILLELVEMKYKEYQEALQELIKYVVTYKFNDEESLTKFYKALYDIDIYGDDFKYQNIDVVRTVLK